MYSIGIRREDKHFESRTPLIPSHVKELKNNHNIQTYIQPSKLRTYPDKKYKEIGAIIEENIWDNSDFIFAIKEIPEKLIQSGKVYTFFSHTIKGQSHNMPLLNKIIKSKSTLIDYEKITTDENRRIIYFGNYAGFAGMIDTFWALGRRLQSENIDTPFKQVKQAYKYESLDQAKLELQELGNYVKTAGTGLTDKPIIIGILGYGNVSRGAQEIINCFPNEEISVKELPEFYNNNKFSPNKIYKVVFYEKHLVKPKLETKIFDLTDYYENPDNFSSQFSNYLSYFMVIVNAIFWDKQYPKFVTKKQIDSLFSQDERPLLRVIGDISCDIEGAIEITMKSTAIDDPVYVYDIKSKNIVMGVKGNGPVILAIDNLPCELPKESSSFFGSKLVKLIPKIIKTDYNVPFINNDLPEEIKKAVIVYNGELTPNYKYLKNFL